MLPDKLSLVIFDFYNDVIPVVVASNTLTVSNLSHPMEMVFFNSPTDMSIGGIRRSNERGFDARLEFEWQDVGNQETEILSFFNNIITYKDTNIRLRANIDGNYLYVVPDSIIYNQNYINQIKRTPTTATFLLESLRNSISYD